jgi:serine/threonine protein kinase
MKHKPSAPPVKLPATAKAGLSELQRLRASKSSRYQRQGELASGGMGTVVKVWDRLLHRPLAMKLLPTRGKAASEDAVARFLREVQVAAQLQHPGVIQVHDLGLDERHRLFYTMPLVDGRELGSVFDQVDAPGRGEGLVGPLRALARLCDVVAYAHSRDVIHGDIKPANVLVGPFDELYVVDWGLATLASDPRDDGFVSGTPPYMSPEQAEGRVGLASDVYAIGAMLYRLLSGRTPYAPRHGKEDPEKTIELIKRGPPTPVELLVPEAPAELASLCSRAMARDPDERVSAKELATGLRQVAEGLDGREPRT